jgi:hypothetical protein
MTGDLALRAASKTALMEEELSSDNKEQKEIRGSEKVLARPADRLQGATRRTGIHSSTARGTSYQACFSSTVSANYRSQQSCTTTTTTTSKTATPTETRYCMKTDANLPGTVHGRNGVAVGTSVLQKSQKVIASDHSRRDEIIQRSHFQLLLQGKPKI